MRYLPLLALCALVPFAAFAQDGGISAATYAAATESVETAGAREGLLDSGAGAAGYSYVSRSSSSSSSVFGRDRRTVTYTFRFRHGDADALRGACRLRSEGRSLFGVEWNQRTAQLYSCEFRDQTPEQYAMDVAVPAFGGGGFSMGGVSMSASREMDAETQAILHAKLVYQGVSYEAAPIGFARENMFSRRIVTGYVISRDGQAVGRIEFRGNSADRATITLPAAETDGREAVLFMALALQGMPDLYAAPVRSEVLGQ